jgi:hypothetical protein
VDGDSRYATLGCTTPSSGLPVPMGLADPLHLAHPLHLPHHDSNLPHPLHLAHPIHLAVDSDLVLNLADLLHLAHPDFDLVLDSNSNYNSDFAVPNGSSDDVGSESSRETALEAPRPNQSHHPKEGEAEDGGCHPVVDHPCLHAIG